MRQRVWWCGLSGIVVGVCLAGCEQQKPSAAPDPAVTGTLAAGEPGATGATSAERIPNTKDPTVSIRASLIAIVKGRLDVAYDFLPSSYQQDVDSLVQTFAARMDADLWNGVFSVFRKAVDVLKTKRDLVLPLVQQFALGPRATEPQAAERLEENWSSLIEMLELIVQSDLSDLERLKRASIRQFLATTGNKMFAQVKTLDAAGDHQLAELTDVTIDRVSGSGAPLVLKIQWARDPVGSEHEFLSIDGRWIPKSLADQWPQSIQQIQDELDKMSPPQFTAIKPEALAHLKGMEAALDAMREATKPEQFFGAIVPLKQHFDGLQHALTLKAAPPGSVVLTIDRELPEDEETALIDGLVKLTDNPDRATYTATKSGGRTRISLSHVKNIAAFAERLSFATAKSVDVEARTIALEVK